MKFPDFYKKFKENCFIKYKKIKKAFLNINFKENFNYNQLDNIAKEILDQNSILERQIIVKCLIFEIDPSLNDSFEILSIDNLSYISLKKNNESDSDSSEWLDILFNSDYSNKNFRIYDPFKNKKI